MTPTIQALFRYPIKGLTPERLRSIPLTPGHGVPHDRRFAITNGGWAFDPAQATPRPKTDYLMLLLHEDLAHLDARFDDVTNTVVVRSPDGSMAQAALHDTDALQAVADFVATHCGKPLPGRPRLIQHPELRFTDASVASPQLMHAISVINLASLRELERVAGITLDIRRFRANIYYNGLQPWEEHNWIGQDVGLGPITAHGLQRIRRCAATNVNPSTAQRDVGIPQLLLKHFGHTDLGVYLSVQSAGTLTLGDPVRGPTPI